MRAVKVDVDFLNPVVATVKESAQDIWAKMPQPVQQHGPIISAVLVTALIVHNIEKGRLRAEVRFLYTNDRFCHAKLAMA